ncbi:MAG: hypothetical protein NT150_05170 [Bacteroidetes bacterium]|nr:hypothetical protein [Bacteroidota bacterium]
MKKLLVICLSTVLLFTSAFVGSIIFEDHFNENENGWDLGEKESANITIKNGKLLFECKKYLTNKGGYWVKTPDLNLPESGFTAKCTTKWIKNRLTDENYSPYGFIIGSYYFLVYADGERRLLFYNSDAKQYETIVDWGKNSAIKTKDSGENQFEISYREGKVSLYCNGEMLFKKPMNFSKDGEHLKLYTENSEVIEFDDLVVTKD